MIDWVNNEKVLWKKTVKPCQLLGWCVYGQLVEVYPLQPEGLDPEDEKRMACEVFGHHCPIFYQAEPISEEPKEINDTDLEAMYAEFDEKLNKKE